MDTISRETFERLITTLSLRYFKIRSQTTCFEFEINANYDYLQLIEEIPAFQLNSIAPKEHEKDAVESILMAFSNHNIELDNAIAIISKLIKVEE